MLSIASGETSATEWGERIENGRTSLFFNSQTQRIEDVIKQIPDTKIGGEEIIVGQEEVDSFSEARIPAYE